VVTGTRITWKENNLCQLHRNETGTVIVYRTWTR
jgi:hypothetical protein